jgi:cobalt-zinc-cadmium efflux system protein
VSLVVAALIVVGTWSLLADSTRMALQGVPPGIDLLKVRRWLETQPGVDRLHDLHIWPMSTTETALTCHLVMPGGHPGDAVLAKLCEGLSHEFRIGHTTIQIETGSGAVCALEPDQVV